MRSETMLIVGLVLLPAAGLATWAWLAMARIEDDLRSFGGFEGMHFEIGPHAADGSEGTPWPTPG